MWRALWVRSLTANWLQLLEESQDEKVPRVELIFDEESTLRKWQTFTTSKFRMVTEVRRARYAYATYYG